MDPTPAPDPDSPEVVYDRMRWNTPLSEDHAELLLAQLDEVPGQEVLDLGCGWGELLIRAVTRAPHGRGTGVDNADWAVERGRRMAADRRMAPRIEFVVADASAWAGISDRVLCIGASHAWGGSPAALRSLRSNIRPGGRLVFGDACWETPPTQAASALFGDGVLALDALVDEAMTAGWRVLHTSTADQREWDDFESSWRAGRERWLQSSPADNRAREVTATLDHRLRQYMGVYRGVLGFAYLVLGR
jgi:cyclopropane fatty-acyl-phospholipid synthase-like methyltransferase